jgi:hypothetical protein
MNDPAQRLAELSREMAVLRSRLADEGVFVGGHLPADMHKKLVARKEQTGLRIGDLVVLAVSEYLTKADVS